MGERDDMEAEPDEDEFEFDCHRDPLTGLCDLAGTEDCDWECPYRQELERPSVGPGLGR